MEFGAILSKVDIRDYRAICTSITSFPEEFELDIRRVKNQGSVGSCVAHALSSVIEYYNYIQLNKDVEMSTGYIYGNRKNSAHVEKGMIVRDALATVCSYGDVTNILFPYNIEVPEAIDRFNESESFLYKDGLPSRFTSYYTLRTEDDIKASLLNKNPVIIVIRWYNDIMIREGIIDTELGNYRGYHCMVVYGWNKDGWLIQNSWGESWGNKGRAILPYNVPLQECWGVTDTYYEDLDGLSIKRPFSSKTGKIIAKVINFILNLVKQYKK